MTDPTRPTVTLAESCPGTVGEKPYWMSWDQYDADGGPCKCILPPGHEPPCACEHTIANDQEPR